MRKLIIYQKLYKFLLQKLNMKMGISTLLGLLVLTLELFMSFNVSAANPVKGTKQVPAEALLSFSHYMKTCPQAEGIIQQKVGDWLQKDFTLAASIIRLHFHDCVLRVSKH